MIILLTTATWIFLIVLVISLCLSARLGDQVKPTSDVDEHPLMRSEPLALAHDHVAEEHWQAQPDDPQQAAA